MLSWHLGSLLNWLIATDAAIEHGGATSHAPTVVANVFRLSGEWQWLCFPWTKALQHCWRLCLHTAVAPRNTPPLADRTRCRDRVWRCYTPRTHRSRRWIAFVRRMAIVVVPLEQAFQHWRRLCLHTAVSPRSCSSVKRQAARYHHPVQSRICSPPSARDATKPSSGSHERMG